MSSSSAEPTRSSSSTSGQPMNPPPPPHRTSIYFHSLPGIQIFNPPKGRYSPQVDERCFTYCTQSAQGRTTQAEPWCRSICIRRVFGHEVRRTLAVHDHTPQSSTAEAVLAAAEAKYPLPPEGQPALPPSSGPQASEGHEWDEEFQWTPSISSNRRSAADTKYWTSGWYLWVSKSRWAAQEKMDLMMCDLAKQAEWQRYKDRVNQEWAEYQKHARSIGELAAEDMGIAGVAQVQSQTQVQAPAQTQTEAQAQSPTQTDGTSSVSVPTQAAFAPEPPQVVPAQVGPPFPDMGEHSVLLPVPPPLTSLEVPLRNLFAPTQKLLALTYQSVVSGQQKQLAQKLWEKAQTDEPFRLARNACAKVWQAFKENAASDDASKGRDRNS